jgi:hypothetical protein
MLETRRFVIQGTPYADITAIQPDENARSIVGIPGTEFACNL